MRLQQVPAERRSEGGCGGEAGQKQGRFQPGRRRFALGAGSGIVPTVKPVLLSLGGCQLRLAVPGTVTAGH